MNQRDSCNFTRPLSTNSSRQAQGVHRLQFNHHPQFGSTSGGYHHHTSLSTLSLIYIFFYFFFLQKRVCIFNSFLLQSNSVTSFIPLNFPLFNKYCYPLPARLLHTNLTFLPKHKGVCVYLVRRPILEWCSPV